MWGEVWPAYHIYGYTSRYLDPFSNKMQWMMASMRAAAAGGGGDSLQADLQPLLPRRVVCPPSTAAWGRGGHVDALGGRLVGISELSPRLVHRHGQHCLQVCP